MKSPLTPEIWQRIEPILDAALELPVGERAACLDRACAGDTDLRARVEALLAAAGEASGFLETPIAAQLRAVRDSAPDVVVAAGAGSGERIGPYRVLRELGHGGMGAVYLAERADGQFDQRLALKLIRRGMAADDVLRRFLRERQILARLEHPHIARLLDGGLTADGRPYFAMEYVEGAPITRYADAHRLGIEERLRLFVGICEAVGYAHRVGVVHRDLKPANLLVNEAGEVKLLDFGIAKLLQEGEEGATTGLGLRLMTPGYAAPEQVRGEPITAATDIHGLGVVLYELLTGHHPFRVGPGDTPSRVERRVCEQEPPRPSARVLRREETHHDDGSTETITPEAACHRRGVTPQRLRRRLAGDLDSIVLRALEKEPARRYPSADALAEDLRRHLARLPVRARRGTAAYRIRTFARRHRAGVTMTPLLALALGGASAIVIMQAGAPLVGPAAGDRPATAAATDSAVVHRLFEEGLRAFHQQDLHSARRLFRAALTEDSTFALANYYALTTEWSLALPPDAAIEARLLRLVDRLPEPERLLARGRIAWSTADPSLRAIADSITTRYPEEPGGHLLLGQALRAGGALHEALPHLRRTVALDSLGLTGGAAACLACEAFAVLINTLHSLDADSAAEQTAREWVRRHPGSGSAWFTLAGTLERQGRRQEALTAIRRAAPLAPGNPYVPIYAAILDIRTAEFEAADRLLHEHARGGPPDVQVEALWFLIISYRNQGRLRDALATARTLQQLKPDMREALIAEAQVLFEMGRGREAAALFESIAALPGRGELQRTRSAVAKGSAWHLTHAAGARAAAGDTAALESLADSIQALGSRTLGATHQRLHHHVRGLLLNARGNSAAAALEFHRATLWPDAGSPYSRTSLELGRVLVSLDRPRDAIATLQPALHGPLEASHFYTTHTELHEALGRAFEAAGQSDSARVHYRWVLEAWRDPDPEFHGRREHVRARLAALPM
jgi:serine/threonine protein kinase/tetratricopeptide (TPR) repeat protein